MVYSAELGYDPEEWEECPPPDHFLAFGWFTRLVLAAGAVAFAFLFFYVLERRKSWAREERRASFSAPSLKPDELDALIKKTQRERSSTSQPQQATTANGTQATSLLAYRDGLSSRKPKKRMSEADMFALQQWNKELKEIEQRRLEEAKEVDRRARASAPPQQYQYTQHGSQSPADTPPTFTSSRQHASRPIKQLSQPQTNVDSPTRAPTPPSTPPGPQIPPHGPQLQEEYKRLAAELQQKLNEELLQSKSNTSTATEFQQQLRRKHDESVRAAEQNLREKGAAGVQAADQFRQTFEDQMDIMVEEYNRRLARAGVQAHSSNESDPDHFEQISASPAMFYPGDSDDPDNEATSFTYESGNQVPKHARTTVTTHQQDAYVPELLVNDQKVAGVKKSSSSSEEGFVKIYTDLVEKIDDETQRVQQQTSPAAEAQLKEILQEYDNLGQPTQQSTTEASKTQTAQPQQTNDAQLTRQLPEESRSKSPQGSGASSSRQSPDFESMFPTQPQPQVPVPLVPLAGFQGNFLQQYQQGPDGRLYPQGPDGMFYRQNKKGQLIPISTELQDILQKQQQSGLQQPLIKTTDGNIYQQGANGQFYEQAADGQMYKVPPNIQKLIQQEIQQTLQIGERKSTEPQELIKGPDGVTYEKGPLGQFYEQGPDGKLHRVSADVQKQLLDLVEERKQDVEKQQELAASNKKNVVDPYQKRQTQIEHQLDPPIIQSPDGKIFEKASDGKFYELASDGHLYSIPPEMQPILEKQHKLFLEKAAKRRSENKGSVDEPTPPFDPEYPYHPRRRLPMQPNPNAKSPEEEQAQRPELKRQQNDEETPPILLEPKPLQAKDVHQVKELLQEYDLSTSMETPNSRYDQPTSQQPGQKTDKPVVQETKTDTIQTPKRDDREHRPSPEDARQLLTTPDIKTGHSTPDSAFEFLQPGEIEAELRSHPSPSQSSGGQLHPQHKEHEDLHRSATQPPIKPADHEPKPHRDASEQSHKQRAHQLHDEQQDDPKRLVEADIYVQDAIDYVDNQLGDKTASGFVMEEDMLSSSDKIPLKMQNASADPTSRLVPTNEVFEKQETAIGGFEEGDDAVTFAPDIQTVEVPPDQMSQNSSNYIENLPDEDVFVDDDQDERPKSPASFPQALNPELSPSACPDDQVNRVEQHEAPAQPQLNRHRVSVQLGQQQLDLAGLAPECEVPSREPDLPQQAVAAITSPTQRNAHDETNKVIQFSHPTLGHPDDYASASATPSQTRRATENEPIVDKRSSEGEMLRLHPSRREKSNSPFFKDGQEQQPSAPQFWRRKRRSSDDNASVTSSRSSRSTRSIQKQNSLLSTLGVTSIQELLLGLNSLEDLSQAMRKSGLEQTNLIFGIDYTASNKYQGENSFDGRSLHSVEDSTIDNPYQQVIKIMGRSLAPFASSTSGIPAYGFGDNESGDWGVFPLNNTDGVCKDLSEVLKVYNETTPSIALGGPTNFAPLIYQAIQICQRVQDYHILVIIADGQVTNERATRKAIVQACQFPLSIIVVGVGDGPWDMMKVFDESLPKRPWDNFHFVEYHQLVKSPQDKAGELAFAIHTLLEVPDQYHHIVKMGLLPEGRRSTPLKDSPPRF